MNDYAMGFLNALTAVWIVHSLRGIYRKRQAKKIPPPPHYDPKDVALNRKPDSRWYSLPGGRMELADTGFYITLNPGEPGKVYQGFNPEGFRIVWGNDLASIKRYLEGEARERAEFNPPAGGWAAP